MAALPSVLAIVEGIGSSESPAQAVAVTTRGGAPSASLTFAAKADTIVVDEATLRPVARGSGVVGRLATRGRVPLGYHKDPERSARTFVEIDGERWSLPGDMATIDADGTIHLLGRGALCINTGGEKVYPEEVEAVLKRHPGVADAVVLGAPDERFGQRVVAVVAAIDGRRRAGPRRAASALPRAPRRLQGAARAARRARDPAHAGRQSRLRVGARRSSAPERPAWPPVHGCIEPVPLPRRDRLERPGEGHACDAVTESSRRPAARAVRRDATSSGSSSSQHTVIRRAPAVQRRDVDSRRWSRTSRCPATPGTASSEARARRAAAPVLVASARRELLDHDVDPAVRAERNRRGRHEHARRGRRVARPRTVR